jgi:2-dehydro-3-deoxyphosphogluconate aldolase/(4S)-4-hydroxy-2-oxoglutarate aldolase
MVGTAAGKEAVKASLARSPVVGVVRTGSMEEARRQAHALLAGGIELVEVTFTVPGATELVRELLSERPEGPPWIGMGTVTRSSRVEAAVEAGAAFLVTPGTGAEVLRLAVAQGLFLIAGALSPGEIVTAWEAGADLVKVYPLPPVGGAAYLATVRQPLSDVPMLAAGGFDVEEIPAYRRAGASAFGLGAPLFGGSAEESRERIRRALRLARGEEEG